MTVVVLYLVLYCNNYCTINFFNVLLKYNIFPITAPDNDDVFLSKILQFVLL